MVKTTKRSKKFSAKGGVKSRLEKGGTITKKGKLKNIKKRKQNDDNEDDKLKKKEQEEELLRKKRLSEREEEDMIGQGNLGDMDIDSFFRSVTEKGEEKDDAADEEKGEDKDEKEDEDDSDDDDSDSDDDDSEDDESVDSDDEDVEDAERRMKGEMEKLSKSDPDFHKFLSENESSLLKFGQEEEDDDGDDDDDDDGDEEEEEGDDEDDAEKDDEKEVAEKEKSDAKPQESTTTNNQNDILLTPKLLKSYEQSAFSSHSLKGLKRIVSAYRSACHLSDSSQQKDVDASGRLREKPVGKSFHIDSSVVFDRLMFICLRQCCDEFYYHLFGRGSGQQQQQQQEKKRKDEKKENDDKDDEKSTNQIDENKPLNPRHIAKAKRWNDLKKILQSFFRSTLHLLSEAKEPNLLKFILQSLSKYTPYLTPYPQLTKSYLKSLTSLWSSAQLDTSENYQVVRLNAFLRIRQLAITQPYPFIESTLKASYLAYANRAKFGTASSLTTSLPTLTFMGNCIVELYSLDYASSYQHAFVYIRQLALHLRSALQKKTKDAIRVVYCWQYVHCLKLWTAVLSSCCSSSGSGGGGKDEEAELMKSLIFPLTEIILGVIRLVPTVRYLPLRMHCVRLLQQLAASAELYIPTTSILLDVFDLREVYMKPKKVKKGQRGVGVQGGVRLPLILKLQGDDTLRTSEQLETCLSEVFLLLNREVDLYRHSAGFPEFTFRICQRLRKFSKETKNSRWRAYAKGCIELCERHSEFVIEKRSSLNEAPKDIKRLEILKPPNVPSMRERYEAFIAKEKRLESLTTPAMSEASKEKAKMESNKNKKRDDDDAEEADKKAARPSKKAKKREVNESDLKNVGALEENDEVQEGINWSDEEDDDDNDEEEK